MVEILYRMPIWLLALVVTGAFVVVGVIGTLLTRNWVREHWGQSSDTVGVVVTSASTLYAVLLAMIAVAAWSNYMTFESQVREEANIAGNMYRDAEGLPPKERVATRALLREYVRLVVDKEFPVMHAGGHPDATGDVAAALTVSIARFRPADLGEADIHTEMLREVNQLFELRRLRQESVRKGLLPVLWTVVLVGGVITIMLTTLLASEDGRLGLLLSAGMAAMIGLMVFLIFSVDRPLMGEISITPTPFVQVGERMDKLEETLRRVEPASESTAAPTTEPTGAPSP